MRILGISAYYHDASAAFVEDGRVVCAAAEERFSRQKHDPGFPKQAIEFCLTTAGITAQELDLVVFYEEPENKFTRVLASALAPFPHSRGGFVRAMKAWLGTKLWIRNEISRQLDIHPNRIEFVKHHQSHAAQAFYESGFADAAILTIDAVGEWTSTGLFHGRAGEFPGIRELETFAYPHSLGLAYSAFTAFLGFRPNDAECSTMALAAFGEPVFADQVRKIIHAENDGSYRLDSSYFEFDKFDDIPYARKLIQTFGQPRDFKRPLPFSCRGADREKQPVSDDARRFANIAASVQMVFEEVVLGLARRARSLTNSDHLCFAGGTALNCVANGRLLAESGFKNVFIPPDPGDGGAAIGAAILASRKHNGSRPGQAGSTPYLGKTYEASGIADMIEHLDPEDWNAYRMAGCSDLTGVRLECSREKDFAGVIEKTVEELRGGKVVGWVQDRFESGPRALGNRSILADPSNSAAVDKLSARIKGRAAFRPYALSVAEEDARKALELPVAIPRAARWMQTAVKVKHEVSAMVREATHVDGSTRPQVCTSEDNPKFHRLLKSFGEAKGIGALLNTSFNESGYPMVASPADSLLVFARTDLDTLVVNDLVIRKVKA